MLMPSHAMRLLLWAVMGVGTLMNVGCVTFTRHAIPAYRLPEQFQAPSRSSMEPINFAMLAQTQPQDFVLGVGDLLAVSVAGIIPPNTTELPPPIAITTLNREYYPPGGMLNAPGFGLPLQIQSDGTLSMPLIAPVPVVGKTLTQTAELIRKAYLEKDVVKQGKDQINVTLLRSRVNRVMVLREDAAMPSAEVIRKGEAILSKRGTGQVVDLPIYESDVLHALTASGGLPGVDANNEVWVLRKSMLAQGDAEVIKAKVDAGTESAEQIITSVPAHLQAIRIPLKLCCGEPVPFAPEDVVLHDGDILYIEPRRQEYFYVGGLMPGGQIPIPRDEDLDVLEAVALASGSVGGLAGTSAASVLRAGAGVGNVVPPTRLLILRKLPSGQQLPIRVNLSQAMRNPAERIRVMPGDFIMMYYTPGEQLTNGILNFFNFNVLLN
ncbi:MAG: polysaccharide biosynthesis/export family protein [Pirellulaceae bacterium]|nr:polysaccharide biosynthesis/export family protein [Pirellulaceae bacterium]